MVNHLCDGWACRYLYCSRQRIVIYTDFLIGHHVYDPNARNGASCADYVCPRLCLRYSLWGAWLRATQLSQAGLIPGIANHKPRVRVFRGSESTNQGLFVAELRFWLVDSP